MNGERTAPPAAARFFSRVSRTHPTRLSPATPSVPPLPSSRSALAFGMLLAWALSAAGAVYETPLEFQAEGDFDGDGRLDVLIIDKESGALRIGYQSSPGAPVWSEARASGISGVTGLDVGRVLSLGLDGVAVTAPGANRVTLFEAPTATAPILPTAVFPPSLGPSAVGALDIGGAGNTAHDDLYVVSQENPGPRETLLRNLGTSQSLRSDQALVNLRSGLNRLLLKTGQPLRLGLFDRLAAGTNDSFVALDFQTGAATALLTQSVPLGNAPRPPQFVAARFAAALPYPEVLFFRPGTNTLLSYPVTEPVPGTFAFGAPGNFVPGGTIQQVAVIPGVSDTRLLILFGDTPTNATVATIYAFDGTNAPVAIQSYTNASGFAGAAALSGGNLSLFGSDGSGRSTSFQVKLRAGNGYSSGTSGALPTVSPYAGGANVLLMNGEPFVNASARPLRALRTREWSSSPALTGGPPATVVVRSESYGGIRNGLFNATTTSLGQAPAGVTHALVNQYSNAISVFSLRAASGDLAGRIDVAPSAGEYQGAVSISLTVAPSSWVAHYRRAPNAPWQTYFAPITLFSNTTFQCYAADPGSAAKTALQSVPYSFAFPANTIDSDKDGIPDAVEAAFGLNPTAGKDSDGDGFSDLDEIIRGTNPRDATSVPTNFARLELRGNFDRVVTPLAPDPTGAATLTATGANVRAWTFSRVLLGATVTTNLFLSGVAPSAARYLAVPGDGESLTLEATEYHYALANDTSTQHVGRELVGVVRVPTLGRPELPVLDPALGPGAVQAWVLAASNILVNLQRPMVVGDLTPRSAAIALLLERKIAEALLARGTNWATNLTLFPFRTVDVTRAPVDSAILMALETFVDGTVPSYRAGALADHFISDVESNAAPEFAALRSVANEFWRASAAHHDPNTNSMVLPLDALRLFLNTGTLHPDYAPFFNQASQLGPAFAGVQATIASAPARPTTSVTLEVIVPGVGLAPEFRLAGTPTPVTLWSAGGIPCHLPESFALASGSRLAVFGFSDVPEAAGVLGLEVITLGLASVPILSADDLNGNLLPDAWENAFFGGAVADPFGDADGDGYSNLQEMLEGTDPNNAANVPIHPPANFSAPAVLMAPQGNQLKLVFDWPSGYADKFSFGAKSAVDLGGTFVPLTVQSIVNRQGDTFEVTLIPPGPNWTDSYRFFILTIALR